MRTGTRLITPLLATLLLVSCAGGGGGSNNSVVGNSDPEFDFDEVNAALQSFLAENEVFDGISITLVDRDEGTVHEAAFGDHTLDIVVQLASASKMPSAALLMALDGDASLDYDVTASIDNYLPWDGVYGDRTTEQLLSNTSGIPGLESGLANGNYGPHMCQFSRDVNLLECAETLYTVLVPGTVPPGTIFDYGGSQWQLAGAVVESVTNSTWNQAFEKYIGAPCELDVFTYGNMTLNLSGWTGHPDTLAGQQNAHVEGGAISNMQDYAKILLMHLREGRCGQNQVIPAAAVDFMQVDRAGPLGGTDMGTGYGMGWWILQGLPGSGEVLYDSGRYGSIGWLDMERGIGGFVAVDNYSQNPSAAVSTLVLSEIIPLQQAAVDAARAAAGN